MITLYLDHQIYAYLKNKDDQRYFSDKKQPQRQEHIHKLEDYLHRNKHNFLIFYSHAHLADLSNDVSGDQERLLNDLAYRRQWAHDNFLFYSQEEKRCKYQLIDINVAFNQLLEWKSLPTSFDFHDLFSIERNKDLLSNEDYANLENAKNILINTPAPTWESMGVDESNPVLSDFRKAFPIFNNSENILDYFNNALKFFQDFESNPSIYKNLRTIVKKGIDSAKRTNDLTDKSDITKFIVDIAKLDLTTLDKERFVKDRLLSIVKTHLANQENHSPTQYDLHTQSYFSLDIMNIEVEQKIKTRNMLNDGQHSFYGGHCEIVISEDIMFREKSKLIYKLFGLSTKVYSVEEFLKECFLFDLNTPSIVDDFHERLVFDINNSIISSSVQSSISTHVKSSKLSSKYLYYFNKMLIVEEYENTYLILRHESNSYLNSLPYQILEEVVNKAYQTFGIDLYGKSTYNKKTENDEVENEQWNGRKWKYGKLPLSLEYNFSQKCLQLVYGPI